MPAPSVLKSIQDWYQSQTNGVWEHQYGIEIGTLDNPGWSLKIDLSKTKLQSKEFKKIEMERSNSDWYHCWVQNSIFEAACGPGNLEEILQIFIKWSEG
jgi:Immunity protein 53